MRAVYLLALLAACDGARGALQPYAPLTDVQAWAVLSAIAEAETLEAEPGQTLAQTDATQALANRLVNDETRRLWLIQQRAELMQDNTASRILLTQAKEINQQFHTFQPTDAQLLRYFQLTHTTRIALMRYGMAPYADGTLLTEINNELAQADVHLQLLNQALGQF